MHFVVNRLLNFAINVLFYLGFVIFVSGKYVLVKFVNIKNESCCRKKCIPGFDVLLID